MLNITNDLKLPGNLQGIKFDYMISLMEYAFIFSPFMAELFLFKFITDISNLQLNGISIIEIQELEHQTFLTGIFDQIDQGQNYIRQKYYSMEVAQ
ncbi:hypothetical protein F1737_08955 [Methanoplanus sp. FWC-SCC4]|uniref:Uncharacterized protein n=1 Tax=Methanochimaera problematica TaxID=2609417 RepID=A0AA97FEZ1_9EURY|nr:hypothetical protein [Methanoplanus sp. FWC-SCC4]WOF16808.1 hypothetical protein F1737_08955 [Methanoplanus sp. FWC-SCC4]